MPESSCTNVSWAALHNRVNGLSPNVKQELASIADMVLSFQVRTIGTDFETSMMVSNLENAPENLKILVFRVTPEEGITPETVERIA